MSGRSQHKVNFSFVNGVPLTDSEKRQSRTTVRSNASNRRWRLAKEAAAKTQVLAVEQEHKSKVPATSTTTIIIEDGNTKIPTRRIEATEHRRQRIQQKKLRKNGTSRSSSTTSPVLSSPTKVVNLAQYYFGSMPESEVSQQSISKMLQGTAMSYAQLFPSHKPDTHSQMAKDWFQQCLRTRGILHTALFCQAKRAEAVRPGLTALPKDELVLCQTEAVQAINAKLAQSITACDDDSLRIVFSLTWHGAVKGNATPKAPNQAPMGGLQALRLFMGVIGCDTMHADGLNRMLTLRGGLDQLEMPGLAFLISLGDILTATCNLTRPTWTYGSYAQHVPEARATEQWREKVQSPDHPLKDLGSGFFKLHGWLPAEYATKLQEVLLDMADYTRATQNFLLGPPEERNSAIMADQRNSLQHRLMSLKRLVNDVFYEQDVYDMCWYAAVAYSMIVVFPLSPKAAKFDRLARLMNEKMLNKTVMKAWTTGPDLVIWHTVIGALCAIGTSHRAWFVQVLRAQARQLHITSWLELKSTMLDHLWLPLASDIDGEILWTEVEFGSPRQSPDELVSPG